MKLMKTIKKKSQNNSISILSRQFYVIDLDITLFFNTINFLPF